MRAYWICGLAVSLLAGCAEAPAPDFAQPTSVEAGRAYAGAMRTDASLLDQASPGARRAYRQTRTPGGEQHDRMLMGQQAAAFTRLSFKTCEWRAYDETDVVEGARSRVSGRIEAGYFCRFDAFHIARGGVERGEGSGYFFMNQGRLDFAGRFPTEWEPAAG